MPTIKLNINCGFKIFDLSDVTYTLVILCGKFHGTILQSQLLVLLKHKDGVGLMLCGKSGTYYCVFLDDGKQWAVHSNNGRFQKSVSQIS